MKKKNILYMIVFLTMFFMDMDVNAFSDNKGKIYNENVISLAESNNYQVKFEDRLLLKSVISIADSQSTINCDAIFGNFDEKDNTQPAYYIHFAFNLMKYIAIAILIVFTFINYISAIASSNDDALKKANKNFIKRLIICVIIFFLPMLIEFLLELLGLVNDPLCGTI